MKNVNIEFIFDDEKKISRVFQEFREIGSTRECSASYSRDGRSLLAWPE